jgi:hypothetical protein
MRKSSGELTFLASRVAVQVPYRILTSSSLAARTVIAIAANAVASAVDGLPRIDASSEATVHYNTTPADIVSVGGVAAAPVGSIFQTDSIALKMRWPVSWLLRDVRGLAWMANVNW